MKQLEPNNVWISKSGKLVLVISRVNDIITFECLDNGCIFKKSESYVRATYKLLGKMPAPGDTWFPKRGGGGACKIYDTRRRYVHVSPTGKDAPDGVISLKELLENFYLSCTVNPCRLKKVPTAGDEWAYKSKPSNTVIIVESKWNQGWGYVVCKGSNTVGNIPMGEFLSEFLFVSPYQLGRMIHPSKANDYPQLQELMVRISEGVTLNNSLQQKEQPITKGQVWETQSGLVETLEVDHYKNLVKIKFLRSNVTAKTDIDTLSFHGELFGLMPKVGETWEDGAGNYHYVESTGESIKLWSYRYKVSNVEQLYTFSEKFKKASTKLSKGQIWRDINRNNNFLIAEVPDNKPSYVTAVAIWVDGVVGSEEFTREYFTQNDTMRLVGKVCLSM